MFRPKFSKADIRRSLADKLQRFELVIFNRLKLVGEKFVINARNNGNYLDQTGNLRSSIGYVILKNGVVITENFQAAGSGTERGKGVQKAKSLIEELTANYPLGYVLIVVAGMNYAAAVESKGRDVLTGSAAQAKTDLEAALKEVKRKLKNAA